MPRRASQHHKELHGPVAARACYEATTRPCRTRWTGSDASSSSRIHCRATSRVRNSVASSPPPRPRPLFGDRLPSRPQFPFSVDHLRCGLALFECTYCFNGIYSFCQKLSYLQQHFARRAAPQFTFPSARCRLWHELTFKVWFKEAIRCNYFSLKLRSAPIRRESWRSASTIAHTMLHLHKVYALRDDI